MHIVLTRLAHQHACKTYFPCFLENQNKIAYFTGDAVLQFSKQTREQSLFMKSVPDIFR